MVGSSAASSQTKLTKVGIRALVDRPRLAALTAIDNRAGILAIATTWLGIAALIGVAIWLNTWWASALAILFVAGRQHAMLVMMHDAAHNMLLGHREMNDLASNVTLSMPLFISTSLYRRHHMAHHRYTNTADDPDLQETERPATRAGFLLALGSDLIGLRSLYLLRSVDTFGVSAIYKKKNAELRGIKRERWLFAAFAAVVAVVLTVANGWLYYLLYWFVPMWFVLPALLRIRAVAEHAGRTDEGLLGHARSVDPNLLERALIAPMNIGLHLEHHLFSDVPFYRLHHISAVLRENPALAGRISRTRGYIFGSKSVLGELYGAASRTVTS